MWDKIKGFFSTIMGSNPWPRVLGGVVVLGEAAKMAQDGLASGTVPTDFHDWLMFWLGIGVAVSKQFNKTNAKVATPDATTVPKA